MTTRPGAITVWICIILCCPGIACGQATPEQIAPWKDLINLRPSAADLEGERAARGRSRAGIRVQRIEQARGPSVNFDEYAVTITRLPVCGPRTAEDLLEHLRTHLDEFLDRAYSSFEGLTPEETADWRRPGGAPLGTVMLFRIPALNVSPASPAYRIGEQAAVVTSRSSTTSWTFSPVTIAVFNPGEHPVSGNREFGVRRVGGSMQIYTRAADRAIGGMTDPSQDFIFQGADNLWKSFQYKLKTYVDNNGGQASIETPIVHRPPWQSAAVAALLNKDLPELRVEDRLRDNLRDRVVLREQVIQIEKPAWEEVLKQRAWAYLASALELACSSPSAFARKYRDEGLPGVHLSQADFHRLYAADAARVQGLFDVLKVRRQRLLNDCQKSILDDMERIARPISVNQIMESVERYRNRNRPVEDTSAAAARDVEGYRADIGNRVREEHGDSGDGSAYSERRGINGNYGNFDLSRPDFGPGSTLGR